MDILYSAYVGSTSSWSIVARNVISNLLSLGNKIRVSSTNGWENVPPEIVSLASTQLVDPVFLGYTVPHRLPSITQKNRFIIYNYESSLLPSGWAAIINQHANLVFPASTYAANILRNNGVISDKIVVMPYGVDTDVFHTGVAPVIPRDKFNFLYCAIPHVRKGIDLLLRAYFQNFSAADPVRLILKTSRRTAPPQSFVINIDQTIEEAKALFPGKDLPEIMVIDQVYYSLAPLYSSAHAYVAPSRSEGFGMTTLEAMACGVPVIASAYGGHLDFLNENNSYLVPTMEVEATHQMQYWQYQRGALIGAPDVEELGSQMRQLYERYDDAIPKIQKGLETVKRYNWRDIIFGLDVAMKDNLGIAQFAPARGPKATKTTSIVSPPQVSIPKGHGDKMDRSAARKLLSGSVLPTSTTSPGQHTVVIQPEPLPQKNLPQKVLQQNVVVSTPSRPMPKPLASGPNNYSVARVNEDQPRTFILLYDGGATDKYVYMRTLEAALTTANKEVVLTVDGSMSSTSAAPGAMRESFSSRSTTHVYRLKQNAPNSTVVVYLSDIADWGYYLKMLLPIGMIYYIADIPMDRVNLKDLPRGTTTAFLSWLPENGNILAGTDATHCLYVDIFEMEPEELARLNFVPGVTI